MPSTSIKDVKSQGGKTSVVVHQAGEMPSPVVLKVEFADGKDKLKPMANAKMIDDKTAIVTWGEDVWFSGDRDFSAALDFGKRPIKKKSRSIHTEDSRTRMPKIMFGKANKLC